MSKSLEADFPNLKRTTHAHCSPVHEIPSKVLASSAVNRVFFIVGIQQKYAGGLFSSCRYATVRSPPRDGRRTVDVD